MNNQDEKQLQQAIDKCAGCVRLNPDMKYHIKTCENCNNETLEVYLSGYTFVQECKNCGYGVVGASFFGNCETLNDIIEIIIDFSKADIAMISKFCSQYSVNSVKMLAAIREGKEIRIRCYLNEVIAVEKFLQGIGIDYAITPEIQYSKFYTCTDAIRPNNRCAEAFID